MEPNSLENTYIIEHNDGMNSPPGEKEDEELLIKVNTRSHSANRL